MNKAAVNRVVNLQALVRKMPFPYIDVIVDPMTCINLDKRQQDEVGKFVADVDNGDGMVYGDDYDGQRLTEFVNGDTYLGFFRASKKEGLGTYYYHGTSEFYQGSWLNDRKHGHGTYHWPDGG